MNCDTYLSLLATLPVEELAYGGAREHAAVCRDCDRVTRVVFERERNMVLAYGELYPGMPAETIVDHALVMSRRRKLAFFIRAALGAAAAAGILFVVVSRVVPHASPATGPVLSETFRLQCLSPEQALEVLRPHISSSVSIAARPDSPLGILRVVAPPPEMQRVRSVLDRYDSPSVSQCGVQLRVPKETGRP